MLRSITNRVGLSFAIRVDKLDRNKVFVINRIGSCDTKRIFKNGFDRSPNIDDLETTFEKFLGFFGKMMGYAAGTGGIGLVDVNALNGTADDNWSGVFVD